MNTSLMMNVITMQHHIFNANTSMDISTMMNVLTTQLGTSCSFDSPGLVRNEPTPGSTFARRFNAIGVELFPRRHGYSEGIHGGLRKKSATPTALIRSFYNTINTNI